MAKTDASDTLSLRNAALGELAGRMADHIDAAKDADGKVRAVREVVETVIERIRELGNHASHDEIKEAMVALRDPSLRSRFWHAWKRPAERHWLLERGDELTSLPGVSEAAWKKCVKVWRSYRSLEAQSLACPHNEYLEVPTEYAVCDETGKLTHLASSEVVALRPMVIWASHQSEDGAILLEVGWEDAFGKWCTQEIPREDALNGRTLIRLARWGAPVHSANVNAVARYLGDFELHNSDRLVQMKLATRLGWESGGAFVWPQGATGYRVRLGNEGVHMAGWGRTYGTWENWCTMARRFVAHYPIPMAALYASAVSPLLEVLGLDGFTFDLSGQTSSGKTSALTFVCSFWGAPWKGDGGVLRSCDTASTVGPEILMHTQRSLPMFMDETQHLAKSGDRGKQILEQMLYAVTGGMSRVRGAKEGGLQATRTWRLMMLTTGESSMASFAEAGGAVVRAMCIRSAPFPGEQGSIDCNAMLDRVMDDYGHGGRRWTDWLERNQEKVRADWPAFLKGFTDSKRGAAHRMAKHVAVIAFAGHLLHEHLEVPGSEGWNDVVNVLHNAATDGVRGTDRPGDALDDVVSWVMSSGDSVSRYDVVLGEWGSRDKRMDCIGRIDMQGDRWARIYVVRSVLVRKLREFGYDDDNVLTAWLDRGISGRDSEGKGTVRKALLPGRGRVRVVVIDRNAVPAEGCPSESVIRFAIPDADPPEGHPGTPGGVPA